MVNIENLNDIIKNGTAKDLILYHGSKGGIDGDIEPVSRVRCDFGRGFYMGTDLMQAKSLVATDDMPYYYKLKFHISKISPDKILFLNDEQWLYTVLSCRHAHPEFDKLNVAKNSLKKLKQYDVVIGVIADDKMREAMMAFTENALTDKGLYHCLSYVDYGLQVVAKTDFACSQIEIIDEKPLRGAELQMAEDFSIKKRMECRNIVDNAKMKYSDIGKTFYNIIKQEKRKESQEWER